MENAQLPPEIAEIIFSSGTYAEDIYAFCSASKRHKEFCKVSINWYYLLKKRLPDIPSSNNILLKDVVFERAYLQLDELEKAYGQALWDYLDNEYYEFVDETIKSRRMIDLAVCIGHKPSVELIWGSNAREGRILRQFMMEKENKEMKSEFLKALKPGIVDIMDKGWREMIEEFIQTLRTRSYMYMTPKHYEQIIYIAALYDDIDSVLDLSISMMETNGGIGETVEYDDFMGGLLFLLFSQRNEAAIKRIMREAERKPTMQVLGGLLGDYIFDIPSKDESVSRLTLEMFHFFAVNRKRFLQDFLETYEDEEVYGALLGLIEDPDQILS